MFINAKKYFIHEIGWNPLFANVALPKVDQLIKVIFHYLYDLEIYAGEISYILQHIKS